MLLNQLIRLNNLWLSKKFTSKNFYLILISKQSEKTTRFYLIFQVEKTLLYTKALGQYLVQQLFHIKIFPL
jgi:hypothetical protein